MNILFISPYFPENFEPFITRMKQKGAHVFGIGDQPYHLLSAALKESLSEYYWVSDMEDYDAMYRALAFLSYKHGKMDRLESHNEYWLVQDARLRTDFNIWGLKSGDMERLKHKSHMKEVFRSCDIPVAGGRVFHGLDDALALANELGYPVIVKPDNGVGGDDTHKITSSDELRERFAQFKDYDYIMEEFLDGTIVTFDGLCDQNGDLVYFSHFVYDRNCLDVINNHQEMLFRVEPHIPAAFEAMGRRAIAAFGLKERFFHMEFFQVGDQYYGLEINCRPPGGLCFDVLNYANDIDLFAEYANIVVDNRFTSTLTNQYYTYYVSRLDSVDYQSSIEDLVARYQDAIKLSTKVPSAFSNILGDHAVIFRTLDLQEAYDMVNHIIAVRHDH